MTNNTYTYYNTVTPISASNSRIWTNWTATSSTQVSMQVIWQVWNEIQYRTIGTFGTDNIVTQPVPQITPEEQLARQEQRAIVARERIERDRLAIVRATHLLDGVLTDEQRSELLSKKRFHVMGSKGRRYCIHARGQAGNVELLDDKGKSVGRFCAHPGAYVPDPDAWLAQMLALQTDEDAFLRVANVHEGRLPADLVAA